MAKLSSCNWMTLPAALPIHPHFNLNASKIGAQQRGRTVFTTFAAKSGGFSLNSLMKTGGKRNMRLTRDQGEVQVIKRCQKCGGQGAIECPGCKGTGKNKKNGNIFERWKCFDCQGFGLKSCPECGRSGGLTPEQRGER